MGANSQRQTKADGPQGKATVDEVEAVEERATTEGSRTRVKE